MFNISEKEIVEMKDILGVNVPRFCLRAHTFMKKIQFGHCFITHN